MPILTADNLATRSRQARFAIDRCTAPPESVEELNARIASRSNSDATRAVAWIFGPVVHPLRVTSYGPHFSVGVSDHETYCSFASLGSGGLRSIEQVLAGLQEEFPATRGFDIVFAMVPMTGDSWPAGLKADYELRECHARARRTAHHEGLRHVWYVRT